MFTLPSPVSRVKESSVTGQVTNNVQVLEEPHHPYENYMEIHNVDSVNESKWFGMMHLEASGVGHRQSLDLNTTLSSLESCY